MSPVGAPVLIAGRYQLNHRVATDRFAEVWHGTDVELARPVAVKLLHAKAGDDNAVTEFRTGACRAGSLTHEGLVRVFDYYEPEAPDSTECPFLVMEYVDGQSLASQLRAGPLGEGRVVEVIAQVSAALAAVHEAGLTHGDIRPEKILLSSDGAAKIFGFSGTRPAAPAAIGADLRALGLVVRECQSELASARGSAPLATELRASLAELAAELEASESADQPAATAAIARRAAGLRGQPRAMIAPLTTLTMARLPKRGRAAAVRTSAVIAIALAGVALFGALRPNASALKTSEPTKPASVPVTASKLIGRPVGVVRRPAAATAPEGGQGRAPTPSPSPSSIPTPSPSPTSSPAPPDSSPPPSSPPPASAPPPSASATSPD
jgi:eukaryotic-like serine/threonine-protein kinase